MISEAGSNYQPGRVLNESISIENRSRLRKNPLFIGDERILSSGKLSPLLSWRFNLIYESAHF